MGMIASQGRFLMLTAKKSDVEFAGQQINQARMVLANKSAAVNNSILSAPVPTMADFNGDTAAYETAKAAYDTQMNNFNNDLAPLQLQDKKLELQLKALDTEQQAISTELDAVSKVIDKNIEGSFKTFG